VKIAKPQMKMEDVNEEIEKINDKNDEIDQWNQ